MKKLFENINGNIFKLQENQLISRQILVGRRILELLPRLKIQNNRPEFGVVRELEELAKEILELNGEDV